ncbi:hypothetical protein QBC36DRAFT_191675, partial [Triangularia setosa]
IADLGLVKTFNSNVCAFDYWATRTGGKTSVFTPEQFSEEWDYISGNPRTINSETAGNYGCVPTNHLFPQIIWQMVALCHAESPPVIQKINIKLLDGTEITDFGFGGYILDDKRFKYVDHDLRELISQCILHTPSKRSTMGQAEAVLEATTKRQGVDSDNQEEVVAQRYREWLFRENPAPKPPQPRDYKLPDGLKG